MESYNEPMGCKEGEMMGVMRDKPVNRKANR